LCSSEQRPFWTLASGAGKRGGLGAGKKKRQISKDKEGVRKVPKNWGGFYREKVYSVKEWEKVCGGFGSGGELIGGERFEGRESWGGGRGGLMKSLYRV